MSTSREFILIYGKDELLLETRKMLLKQAGYPTLSTTSAYLAQESLTHCNIGVLVLCHTLSNDDVRSIVRFHHEKLSTASILYLRVGESVPVSPYGNAHDAQQGPAAFLAAVHKLSVVYHC